MVILCIYPIKDLNVLKKTKIVDFVIFSQTLIDIYIPNRLSKQSVNMKSLKHFKERKKLKFL